MSARSRRATSVPTATSTHARLAWSGASSRPITTFPGTASSAPTGRFPRDSRNESCCALHRRRHRHRRTPRTPRHGRDPGLADRRSLEIHLHDRNHDRRSTRPRPLPRHRPPDRQLPRRHRRSQVGLHHRRPTHHAPYHRPIAARQPAQHRITPADAERGIPRDGAHEHSGVHRRAQPSPF